MQKKTIQVFCDRCGKEIPETEPGMFRAKGVKFIIEMSSVEYYGARGGTTKSFDYLDLCNDCSRGLMEYLKLANRRKNETRQK